MGWRDFFLWGRGYVLKKTREIRKGGVRPRGWRRFGRGCHPQTIRNQPQETREPPAPPPGVPDGEGGQAGGTVARERSSSARTAAVQVSRGRRAWGEPVPSHGWLAF